jgi:L-fuconolactonase
LFSCHSAIDVNDMPVVDTHMHLFDMNRKEGIPWPPKDDKVLYHVTLPEHFIPIAQKNGITKVIVVQAGDRLIDNQWNLDITEPHKDLFVGVVGDLLNIGTKDFKPTINKLAKNPHFVGIRILLRNKNRKLFSGTIWEDLQQLSDKNLTLDVLMNDHKVCFGFEEVLTIAQKYPKLNVVMNHVGGYPIDGKKINPAWAKQFKEVAKNKNVYCKVSAMLERSVIRPYSFKPEDYETILSFLLETFGEDRLLYGSDWPVTKRSGTYGQHKKVITDFFSGKGKKVLKKVMYDNAHTAYHLEK